MPRQDAIVASLLCLAATPVLAGCGESNPASQATATSAQPATTTVASTSQARNLKPAAPSSAEQHHSARAKARVRQAFSSLANAKPAPKLPATQRAHLAVDDIELTSPAVHSQTGAPATIATASTCYGADRSPGLNWKNIPSGTAELAIFVISTTPVDNQLYYDWIVTGLNPGLHGILAGQTPAGATTHPNSKGSATYSICPPSGKSETYLIAVYALPTKLQTTPGETPNQLHLQALHTARHSGLLVGSYQHK
jgi:phosphatidylethanolamine-binding protein (PEBP) family uncharacterized protein